MGRLTKSVMATIPAMVADGLKLAEISERLGCKTSTLRVRCSQERINLFGRAVRLRLRLPVITLSENASIYFRRLAKQTDCAEHKLVADLLEIIAKDDLYNAVVDNQEEAKKAA
jgi:hypothetical protein